MHGLFWGIVLILLGLLFLLDNLEVVEFGDIIGTYWPALLVLWGLSVLLKKKGREPMTGFSDVARKVDEDLFHQSNVFGDVDIRITSQNFKGGSVSAVFGDCEVDLTGSTIADGEHWLKMNGVFGNARIVVPPDLPVAVLASTVFGDVKVRDERKSGFSPSLTYKSPDYDASHRKLSISVSQVFGSVRVQ